jgi:hypothetical protein
MLLLAARVPAQSPPDSQQSPPPADIITAYDLERHIGLIAFDKSPAVARRNAERLNAALDAMHPAGKFAFADGSVGPILHPVRCAAKPFYFLGCLKTSRTKSGGTILGTGTGSPHGQLEYSERGQIGQQTQFIRLDVADREADNFVFLLRHNGFTLADVYLFGQAVPGNINSGTGPRTAVGLGVEARLSLAASGKHRFTGGIVNCDVGIKLLRGWYDDDGKLHDDVHADDLTVDAVIFGCPTAVLSENDQAVWCNWKLRVTATGAKETCVFDVAAGGLWAGEVGIAGGGDWTLLRFRDGPRFRFSPNASRYDFRFYRDGAAGRPDDLCLVEYAGTQPVPTWFDPDVRITGNLSTEVEAKNFQQICRLNGMPSAKIWLDLNNLEHVPAPAGARWEQVGPWRRLVK